ncbi:Hypothetical predicted protein [Cloeon dipterum]|uniref:Uncharacterized protein n=1 Tax=Cloeon dipterum TaxID=197152 RepID=A0A8S1CA89_9INSE|nr:Hypothetical predicted protein [Cloeon dipterum]
MLPVKIFPGNWSKSCNLPAKTVPSATCQTRCVTKNGWAIVCSKESGATNSKVSWRFGKLVSSIPSATRWIFDVIDRPAKLPLSTLPVALTCRADFTDEDRMSKSLLRPG